MQMVGDGLFTPPLSVVLWATSTTHTKKISAIGSREAPNQPHAAPLASSVGEQQTSAIAENTDDEVKGNQKKTLRFQNCDEHTVKCLGLSEVRIMAFHCHSGAFTNKFLNFLNSWTIAVLMASQDEADVIMGDGNRRGFKHDTQSDFWTTSGESCSCS